MSSLVTLSSEQDGCEHVSRVGVASGATVWTKELYLVVVVLPSTSVARVSSFSIGSDPEVPSIVHSQDVVDEHISPAITPSVSNLLPLSLPVKVSVALSVSAGVTHNLPVNSHVSVILLLLPDVVADLTEFAGVPVPSLRCVTVVVPSASWSSSTAHTSPHDRSGPVSLVSAGAPAQIAIVTVPLHLESILGVSVVTIR
jgi:hypothetical protein